MGIRSNKHGKKSDKETQSPLLNVFTEMMERDKRTRQGDIEQRNLITRDSEKRKSKTFPPRSARRSDEPLTGVDTDEPENTTYVRSHTARQPVRPSHSIHRSQHSSHSSRLRKFQDDTCSVSCAFKRLAGSEYGCVVCLLLVFSLSLVVSCCMVYSNHHYEAPPKPKSGKSESPGSSECPASSETPGTPHTQARLGPSLRELNFFREADGHVAYSSSSPLMLAKRDESRSDKIKDFYKKLVQTDAKIQYLKKLSQLNSPEPNENKPMSRLKRSLKWYKYPKRAIEKRYDDFDFTNIESTTSDQLSFKGHDNEPKDDEVYHDNEPRGPTAFVIERKKVIVRYDPPLLKKIVPKCSHFQKDYSTHHHEHQLKHPFYQNTQKVDELLDKFLNKNLPEVVTDPFGFDDLFKNNTKLKCKHTNVKNNYMVRQKSKIINKDKEEDSENKDKSKSEDVVININSLRCDNSVKDATKNKKNRDFRTVKENNSQKNDFSFTKAENSKLMSDDTDKEFEPKYFSQESNTLIENEATTISSHDIMSVSTLCNVLPLDKDKLEDASVEPPALYPFVNPEYQAPNTRHLMQLNEDEENLGYEDFKEILTDDPENQDDNDRRVESRRIERKIRSFDNREPIQEIKQWLPSNEAQDKQPKNLDWIHGRAPAKLKPPSGVHNPNWKGAMPLYPDEVNSMLKVSSEDMLSEKPNLVSTAHKIEKAIYKSRPTMSRRQDTFSDVDYIEEYFDNKYGKLTQMAQAYSDYGVLEAKKDVRKEKNKIADLHDSVDKIESDDDELSRKRRHDDEMVLYGLTPNNAQKNEDYIVDTSSWKNFVSKVLGKLVKISQNKNFNNIPETLEVTGMSISPDYSMSTTTMSALEYPTMPLSYAMKSPLCNSKTKLMKQDVAKGVKANYYGVNKGRSLLSTLEKLPKYEIALDDDIGSGLDITVLDDTTIDDKNNVLNNCKEMIDLKFNKAHINKDDNDNFTTSNHEKVFSKNNKFVRDLKLLQNQTNNIRVFNDSYRPTSMKATFTVKPISYISNDLSLQQNSNKPADFGNFAAEPNSDTRIAIRPITIKELFEAFGNAKNHTELCGKHAKPIDTLDSLTYGSNVSKFAADRTIEYGMAKASRNQERLAVNVKTIRKTKEPLMNVHDTIFVANNTLNENQLKYRNSLDFSGDFREQNYQSFKSKFETTTVNSNITKSVGYRSRVLLATKEDNANKTGKESEIDIEVSIQKNNPKNVTKRESKTAPTTSIQTTITDKNKTMTETNKHTTTNSPKKDSDTKQKVKRNADDINLIAWSDIYDDDYGIQTDEFNLNHKKKENDFIKRSGKWVQDKIRKLAENLKGHDTEEAVKKRSIKDSENPGSLNKPSNVHNRQKRAFIHLGSKHMFRNLATNLPVICKKAATAVQKTRTIEVSEDDTKDVIAASLMEQMVKLMVNMVTYHVEQRSCAKLPSDLQGFLLWLTVPEEETLNIHKNDRLKVAQHDATSDYEPLISLYHGAPPKPKEEHSEKETIQDYFNQSIEDQPLLSVTEFAQHTPNLLPLNEDFEAMYLSTVQSIKELLDMFNDMKPEDKNQMAGVRLYLQKQLLSLNRMMSKNQMYDSYQKSNWPHGTQRPQQRLQARHQVKQASKKHTRTTVNQTVSISVTDRVNVKKKLVTPTEPIQYDKKIITHNNKRNLQDVYYKAIADAKKFGTRFAKNGHTTQSIKSFTDSLHTREREMRVVDTA